MHIFIPALVLGIYTLLFFFFLGISRNRALKNRELKPAYYETFSGDTEPRWLQVRSRHAANLLEMPMLFYAVVLMIHASGASSTLFVALAWAFVLSRAVHAYLHLGQNVVLHRFLAFGVGALVLLAMWVLLLVRLLAF